MKKSRDIMIFPVDISLTYFEIAADGNQVLLPLDFTFYDLRDQVKLLDTLNLHTGTIPDRDIDVLAYRPESAFDLACRAEDHPQVPGDFLHLLRRMHAGRGRDLDERDPEPVKGENFSFNSLGSFLFEA